MNANARTLRVVTTSDISSPDSSAMCVRLRSHHTFLLGCHPIRATFIFWAVGNLHRVQRKPCGRNNPLVAWETQSDGLESERRTWLAHFAGTFRMRPAAGLEGNARKRQVTSRTPEPALRFLLHTASRLILALAGWERPTSRVLTEPCSTFQLLDRSFDSPKWRNLIIHLPFLPNDSISGFDYSPLTYVLLTFAALSGDLHAPGRPTPTTWTQQFSNT
ncbi:hypothetical protein B0H63DRAFT_64946 [Podospora didyma]|uniref:Uncharacterized protein n=1 Tax=Podospora didyma TaxID=330526 RepID=A0AAE0P8D3_9PEZI|nr:hypothetical protein B0H63DRAFT_64946 [Podospora didyma]